MANNNINIKSKYDTDEVSPVIGAPDAFTAYNIFNHSPLSVSYIGLLRALLCQNRFFHL